MATDSLIGYATVTLEDPPLREPSEIGFQSFVLSDPSLVGSSQIGGVPVTLRRPHHPRAVMTTTGLKYVPRLTWDGEQLR